MNHRIGMVGGSLGFLVLLGSLASGTVRPSVKRADGVNNVVYVSGTGDDEANDGLSSDAPLKTMSKAFDLVSDNGTIVLCGALLSGVGQDIFPAKNVKITSKINSEDYTASALWRMRSDMFFQGNVDLDDITLTAVSDTGFCANGYDFHIGSGVQVTGSRYINIAGGYAPLKNQNLSHLNGANVVVEGGSKWDIFAAGSFAYANCEDEVHLTEDVNLTVKGNASVHSIYGAFSDRTMSVAGEDGSISTLGNVNLNIEDNAKVSQLIVGSDAQNSARMHQDEGKAFTVNLGKDVTIGAVIGGGLYTYETPSDNLIGPESLFESIVINYYGGHVSAISVGGVEIPDPTPGFSIDNAGFIEKTKDFRINLYESLAGDIIPGYVQDAYQLGYPTLSQEIIDKVTVAIYNGSTFNYDPYDGYAAYHITPFELKNRTVCYMDSGDRDVPMSIPEDFAPTDIEFGTDGEDKESVENNVFCTDTDIKIGGMETDDSNFTIILKGDEVPVVTATDHISSNGGKFNLSFEKDDGTAYEPEEGTLVFQVPAVTTEEEKLAVEEMFILEGMDEDYYVAYEEGVDENGDPIGKLVIKKRPAPVATSVSYQVEHYQEQLDGTYVLVETEDGLVGADGETVTGTPKHYDHYHFDEGNENALNSLTLSADGEASDNVLKLYYKLDTFRVTFNANVYGSFEGGETKIVEEYRYGASFPSVPTVLCLEGYVFDYWVDINGNKVTELPSTVTGNMMFTAVWKLVKDETPMDTPTDEPEEEKPSEETPTTTTYHKEGHIILHVIIGAIIGVVVTLIGIGIKKKIRKGHLTNGLNVGNDKNDK